MQKLATRWEELIQEFTGGNPGIRKSLGNMYQNENPQKVSHGMMDNEVMEFIGKAMNMNNSD
jgi:hypothetical protein